MLYGPPGTGKSSFPYRVAVVLKYHFYSVDIRNYETKGDLDAAFNGNPFARLIHEKEMNGIVHMLDEFDIGVR